MSSKEDYLDSLLQTVSGEAPNHGTALNKLAGVQEDEGNNAAAEGTVPTLSYDDDDMELDEIDFPELAKLFEEDTEEVQEPEVQEPAEDSGAEPEASAAQDEPEVSAAQDEPATAPSASDEQEETGAMENAASVTGKEVPDMDISDFEALLASDPFEEETEPEDGSKLREDMDVTNLIDAMGDDGDLAEISELLKKSDNHEMIDDDNDVESLLQSLAVDEEAAADAEKREPDTAEKTDSDAIEGGETAPKGKKRKERKKKEKKQKDPAEKGPGLLQKIVAFFTDEGELTDIADEKTQLGISRENLAILEELDQEKPKKAKKPKKEKKPKQKKEKKPKPKKEKKPKEKKERKPKPPKEPEKPLKPIGKRKIIAAVFLGLTVFGMIMLFTSYIPDFTERREGKTAFEEGDYKTAYELLSAKKVKGREEEMLKGATLCLQIDHKLEAYENYAKLDGMELEKLHALISGVDKYRSIQPEAEQYGVAEPVKNSYLNILGILQSEYGISEEEAQDIASITDSIAYTKELKRILGLEDETDAAEE